MHGYWGDGEHRASQRRYYGVGGRRRSNAYARLYSVAGGAPNRPLVVFAATACWFRDADSTGMEPQAVIIERGYSKASPLEESNRWIDTDLANWQSEPQHHDKPVLIVVETSQSPHLFRAMSDHFQTNDAIRMDAYRLRTGDQNVTERKGEMTSGAYDCGGNWLASWFENIVPASPSKETLHGRPCCPGKICITFDQFQSEEGPGMGREGVRSSLSAAESLRAKSQKDADLSMALTHDESKAAALMLAVLGMSQLPPSASAPKQGQTPWGHTPWGQPIRVGNRGAF